MKKLLIILLASMAVTALVSPIRALAADQPTAPVKPAVTPWPPLGASAGTRHLTLRIRVDGMDNFTLQDGKLSMEHKSWNKPSNIFVNGAAWQPLWDGKNSDAFARFNPALAPFAGAKVTFRKAHGRGSANILEMPTAANGQKLRFQIDDSGPGGADNYEVHLSW